MVQDSLFELAKTHPLRVASFQLQARLPDGRMYPLPSTLVETPASFWNFTVNPVVMLRLLLRRGLSGVYVRYHTMEPAHLLPVAYPESVRYVDVCMNENFGDGTRLLCHRVVNLPRSQHAILAPVQVRDTFSTSHFRLRMRMVYDESLLSQPGGEYGVELREQVQFLSPQQGEKQLQVSVLNIVPEWTTAGKPPAAPFARHSFAQWEGTYGEVKWYPATPFAPLQKYCRVDVEVREQEVQRQTVVLRGAPLVRDTWGYRLLMARQQPLPVSTGLGATVEATDHIEVNRVHYQIMSLPGFGDAPAGWWRVVAAVAVTPAKNLPKAVDFEVVCAKRQKRPQCSWIPGTSTYLVAYDIPDKKRPHGIVDIPVEVRRLKTIRTHRFSLLLPVEKK